MGVIVGVINSVGVAEGDDSSVGKEFVGMGWGDSMVIVTGAAVSVCATLVETRFTGSACVDCKGKLHEERKNKQIPVAKNNFFILNFTFPFHYIFS